MRVMLFDDTEDSPLEASWRLGALLYKLRGDVEIVRPVRTLEGFLDSLLELDRELDEIQWWGHGWFGAFVVGTTWVRPKTLEGELAPKWEELRARLRSDSLLWFRSCCTFGGLDGQAFARAFADFFDCRVAGHTYVIGPWQSGLHTLEAGQPATWDELEGVKGGRSRPAGKTSVPWAPNTIFCTQGKIPRSW